VIENSGVPADGDKSAATASFEELSALPTEELRQRAFALAKQRHDLGFFWDLLQRLPHSDDAEQLDGSPNSIGPTLDDALELWREFTGHGYGESEPLLRAAFIDYLMSNSAD
jgi:hypothetical protein